MDYAAVAHFSTRLSDAMKHPSFFSSEAATTGLGLEFAPVKKSGSHDRAPNNAAIFPLHANLTAEPYSGFGANSASHFCVPLSPCVTMRNHAQGSHRPEGRIASQHYVHPYFCISGFPFASILQRRIESVPDSEPIGP